ncbi:MAG: type II toxin-antitoxin system VapC family toxin [Candidatus Acidiferrum sp.]
MLYLDSSALIKHYIRERGTDAIDSKFREEEKYQRTAFTSVIAYAEVQAAFARRRRDRLSSSAETSRVQEEFVTDWAVKLNQVELGAGVLLFIRRLVEEFPLKGFDAIHLASALWLRDALRIAKDFGQSSNTLEFASSDRQLNKAASQLGMEIFDPEKES